MGSRDDGVGNHGVGKNGVSKTVRAKDMGQDWVDFDPVYQVVGNWGADVVDGSTR